MSDLQVDVGNVTAVDPNALKSDIRSAIINQKANACPMILRLAWHASGTYSTKDGTGGSDGATMRFAPESEDDANAGLSIARDLLKPVKAKHPEISTADLWVAAGCVAIEFMGGPSIPFTFGRTDASDGSTCPVVGRLPDASQGADHLREVFGRMGFGDRDIVALSGAHTLGRCHQTRSGFDGPWTRTPLKFNNSYYSLLLNLDWKPRKWDGNLQYEAESAGWKLMMLPTDMALRDDPKFRVFAEQYAEDQAAWFKDFSKAFAKLISNGCPPSCQPRAKRGKPSKQEAANAQFRELAMHGSAGRCEELFKQGSIDIDGVEASSGRTALHKAAYWGHNDVTDFLLKAGANINAKDGQGDTAIHDAARFGHKGVIQRLIRGKCSLIVRNSSGKTALDLAKEYDQKHVFDLFPPSTCPRSKM